MLSLLQEQVSEIIGGLDEAEGFALAGGAALIARGDVRRQTRDLDFFGLTAEAVDRLVSVAERALCAAGLVVRQVQINPGFARLAVESGDDRTELDLGADARLFPAEPGRLVPTLRAEELAADKVLAVFGRAEARDFVDLMALEPRFGLEQLCALAVEKDRASRPRYSARCSAGSTDCGETSSSSTTPNTGTSVATSRVGVNARSSSSYRRNAANILEARTTGSNAERTRAGTPIFVRRDGRAPSVPSPLPPSLAANIWRLAWRFDPFRPNRLWFRRVSSQWLCGRCFADVRASGSEPLPATPRRCCLRRHL
ncbi:MAG: nucleotidyl transferase AbiEii/AbiGii toxin family protein [Gaiellaceae bacterium]